MVLKLEWVEGRGGWGVSVEEDDLINESQYVKEVCLNNPVQLSSITSKCVIVIVVGNSVQFIVPH